MTKWENPLNSVRDCKILRLAVWLKSVKELLNISHAENPGVRERAENSFAKRAIPLSVSNLHSLLVRYLADGRRMQNICSLPSSRKVGPDRPYLRVVGLRCRFAHHAMRHAWLCCCVLQTLRFGPEVRISFCAKKERQQKNSGSWMQTQHNSCSCFLQAVVAVQKTMSRSAVGEERKKRVGTFYLSFFIGKRFIYQWRNCSWRE